MLFDSPLLLLALVAIVLLVGGFLIYKLPIKAILALVHVFLMTSTFMLSCYTYNTDIILTFTVPEWFYYFVGFGVVGISIIVALAHVIGGGVMGMAAGGMMDGMRLGLTLGLGMGIGRLWPYVSIWTLGAVIFSTNYWKIAGLILLSLFCVGIHAIVKFFWSKVQA